MADSDDRKSLDVWTRVNAVAMLAASAVSIAVHHTWPLGSAAAVSFSALLFSHHRSWRADRRVLLPNVVTGLRVAIAVSLCVVLHRAPAPTWVITAASVYALDGFDGWLARRTGGTSAFGAHFDMEADALFVLVLGLELFTRGRLGAWIMTAGLLRYAYALTIALAPPRAGEMPRSQLGRNAFGLLVVGLLTALAFPSAAGDVAGAVGTIAVTLSFARSLYWSYLRRSQLPT